MKIDKTPLSGLLVLKPDRFEDDRGFFSESWNKRDLLKQGINFDFVQDNHSFSLTKGTLRGLHFQAPPHAQAKLVRCCRGSIWDVAVDIRNGSTTYGKSYGLELSFNNGKQLLVPNGFLHSFVTLEDETEVAYKCNAYYNKESDGSVLWNSCNIDWPLDGAPLLSDKDQNAISFSDFVSPFKDTT